jgi:hypothetical protein
MVKKARSMFVDPTTQKEEKFMKMSKALTFAIGRKGIE